MNLPPPRYLPSIPSPSKRKPPVTAPPTKVIDLTSPPSTPNRPPRKRKSVPSTAADSPEKRLKRHRNHPPQSVMIKRERVMTQRMFLVERSGRKQGALSEDFSVLGSTGNVYHVNVAQVPR